MVVAACHAQAFNIDVEIFSGGEGIGAGAPSSSFGAAAGQAGFWNPVQLLRIPWQLNDLMGNKTGAYMTTDFYPANGGGDGGFFFEGNTGDYARLLNDAQQVASQIQGGGMTCAFHGLSAGSYQVFTYAVSPIGEYVETSVYVPGSIGEQTQVVTGPMPGNSFKYLITHSIHSILLKAGDDLQIQFYEPPNTGAQFVNGFQIVPIPEPSGFSIVIFGFLFAILRRRRIL
jgi:hypothetical protein